MKKSVKTFLERVAGEVVVSNNPGEALKKWRTLFNISQTELADELGISNSVVSDYETGRRQSPGSKVIKKYLEALIRIDESKGGVVTQSFTRILPQKEVKGSILDLKEFSKPVSVNILSKMLGAENHSKQSLLDRRVYGYTIINSERAIVEMTPDDFLKFFGSTSKRALVFVNAHTGRSIMTAVKVGQVMGKVFKPTMVVVNTKKKLDKVAKKIASSEGIALARTSLDLGELKEKLRSIN